MRGRGQAGEARLRGPRGGLLGTGVSADLFLRPNRHRRGREGG